MTGAPHIQLRHKALAELAGTFGFVLLGCAAARAGENAWAAALGFGAAMAAMIQATAGLSGGHLNPAVSVGLALSGRMPRRWLAAYVLAQCAGAFLAALALRAVPGFTTGLSVAHAPASIALATEGLLSLVLVFVVVRLARGNPVARLQMALVIGTLVAAETMVGLPISGASMNPARSLGPALAGGAFTHLWIYIAGPVLGGTTGALLAGSRLKNFELGSESR